MMRIGWTSNAPWSPTGYGVQTAEIVPRLAADGHKVAIMANYGLHGSTLNFNGIQVMGAGADEYSNDLTPFQIRAWLEQDQSEPGIGITLYDVWVYTHPAWDDIPILSWVPIDHEVVPVGVKDFLNRIGKGKWALAMSRFGEQQLLEAGISRERLFYAPHSFNRNVFKPVGNGIRKEMGIPDDAHVTMINAANKGLTPIRKCWPEMIEAWVKFAQKHDDAYLYIHSELYGLYRGVNIIRMLDVFNAPKERVKVVPQFEYRQGIGPDVVNRLYSMSDVLLMTSRGEGFGIPTIEAQAAGVPVIVTDWTAQSELVGPGWKVDGQKEWDELQTGWWKVPNIDEIVAALEDSYAAKGDKKRSLELRNKSLEFSKQYETGYVYEHHWRPILEQIQSEVETAKK